MVQRGWKASLCCVKWYVPLYKGASCLPQVCVSSAAWSWLNANCLLCLERYFIINSYPYSDLSRLITDCPGHCCLWCGRMDIFLVLINLSDSAKTEYRDLCIHFYARWAYSPWGFCFGLTDLLSLLDEQLKGNICALTVRPDGAPEISDMFYRSSSPRSSSWMASLWQVGIALVV